MRKTYLMLALVAGMTLGATSLQAKDLTGGFVNLGAGSASYHAKLNNYDLGSDTGTAFIINAGYRTEFIGIEAGYTNLGSISKHEGSLGAKLSGDGWTAGINGHFNPTQRWYISSRVGAFLWKLHATVTSNDPLNSFTSRGNKQSMDWYAGVGTGYDFNKRWSAGVNFDYYSIKPRGLDIGNRVFTASVEYRF